LPFVLIETAVVVCRLKRRRKMRTRMKTVRRARG